MTLNRITIEFTVPSEVYATMSEETLLGVVSALDDEVGVETHAENFAAAMKERIIEAIQNTTDPNVAAALTALTVGVKA